MSATRARSLREGTRSAPFKIGDAVRIKSLDARGIVDSRLIRANGISFLVRFEDGDAIERSQWIPHEELEGA